MMTRNCVQHASGIVVLCALAVSGFVLGAVGDVVALERSDWTNYTNINTIRGLTSRGDTVWMATTGGLAYLPSGDFEEPVRITNLEGLGDNILEFVAFGPNGIVWTGGSSGRLSRRWSDIGWSVYPFEDDDTPIPLNCAAADTNGFLWVGSNSGLHKFDINRNGGEIKETYTRIGNWTSSTVNDVMILDDRIWIVGPAGIAVADVNDQFLLDPSRWTTWTSPEGVLSIAYSSETMWVGTSNGVWEFDGDIATGEGSWSLAAFASLAANDLFGSGDTLWIASARGLGRRASDTFESPPIMGTPNRMLTSVVQSRDGTVWCGTIDAGVLRVDDSSWELIAFDGPIDNDVIDVAVDHDGRIWCVHPVRGLDFFDNSEWTHLQYTDELSGPSGPAMAVDVAPDGDIWFAMWGGGGMQIDPDNPLTGYTRYDTSNSSLMFVVDPGGPNNYIVARDVNVDDSGRVWFANAFADSGVRIAYHDDGCWGRFTEDDDVEGEILVIRGQADHLLLGFENLGVGEYTYGQPLCGNGQPGNNGGELELRRTFDGLPSDQVQSILIDRADTLWVGTNAGLVRWIPDLRRFFSVPLPSEAGLSINALAADAFNTIWIGTSRGLVARGSNGEIDFYTPFNSPLVGRDVREIAIDDREGIAWIATGSGVSRIVTGAAPVERTEETLALPNPFEIATGEDREVRFNAPFGSHVYIYTVSGELVADMDASQGWDGRTRDGRFVASGIYLFVIRGPDGDYGRGKLAVIQTR
ncbi:MAG: hypothetical protein GF341_08130 [candidate division Zixibacteria bacterium]|nr:hypothetical protein [candidate division Zixibacteria bacterium]